MLTRPLLPVLIALAMFCPGLSAQIIQTSLPSHVLCPNDSVILPVQVTNFNNVSSISLSLLYDPLRVDFLGYQNVHTALTSGIFLVNDAGTQVKIAWFSINPVNIGTGELLRLRFRYLTGYGTLTWDTISPGGCQYGSATGATLPAHFTSAYLSANGAIMVQPAAASIMAGDTAVFQIQAFGSVLSYKWQENNGSGWVNVVNGLFYAGSNGPQLSILGPPQAFNGREYRCRTTGTCPAPGDQFFSDVALLTVAPPCTTATVSAGPDDTLCAGQSLTLQASASNYTALQWSGGDGVFSSASLLNPIYTPGPGDIAAGGCTLTLTASSAPPCPSTQNSLVLTIQQCPINQAPVFLLNGLPVSAYAMNGLFAHPLSFCLELEDPENDPVSLGTVLQAPIHGTLSGLSDGDTCATYHPYPLFSGTDQFVITGCDAGGRCDTAMVSVSIQLPPYNLAPFLLHNSLPADTLRLNVQMNLASVLCLSVFDPEGEAVDVLQVLMAPDHGLTGGLADGDTCISYAPDTAFSGYDTLSILLCDSSGACDTFYLVLHVLDLNIPYAPQTMDDACQGAEDVALNCPVLLNDFDINMDIAPGSLALLSLPQHGLAQADTLTGMIHYLPLADYWGQDSLEYVICDSSGLCDTAKVRLMLLPVYDPPRPDTFAVGEDSLLLAPVLLNDSFFGQVIDTSTFQVVVAPKHGLAFFPAGSGVFHYLPSPDYFGVDSVEYRHCDTSGACGTAWVRVNVQAVNDLPRVAHVNGVPQGWPGQVTLSACVNSLATWCFGLMDAEGDMASIDGLTAPGLPGVQITRLNDSCFSLMPPPGFSGTALLKLVVHDPMLSGVINLNLVVHPNPSVSAGDDTLICPGALFHASSATSSHASAWLWSSQGSGVFLDPGLLHATYVASNQDILNGYSDLRVIAFGLSPCTTRDTSYIRVGFRPMPALELGLDTTLCLNYRITLDAGPGMAAYSWSTGGSVRYETVDTSNLPFPGGAVSVTITDVQGCTNDDQISITFVGCPGFDEHPWYAPPRLWPNPAKDRVYLAFGNASPDRLVIQLADMSGQVFRQQCLVALSGDATFELDVSDLVSGIYLLHCQRGEASHTLKLILLP